MIMAAPVCIHASFGWLRCMLAGVFLSERISLNVLYNIVLPEGFRASGSSPAVKTSLYHGAPHGLYHGSNHAKTSLTHRLLQVEDYRE
jgi:hypothetical protein